MKPYLGRKIQTAFFGAVMVFGAASANATTYTFTQDGFNGGGALSGFFAGSDIDHNGKITTEEITDFHLSVLSGDYRGVELGIYYSHGYRQSPLVSYTVGSQYLGNHTDDVFGFNSWFNGLHYYSNTAGSAVWGDFPNDPPRMLSSHAILITSPVPEPESWAMMLAGVLLIPALAKRKKAA